jgi:hypothetical protein
VCDAGATRSSARPPVMTRIGLLRDTRFAISNERRGLPNVST